MKNGKLYQYRRDIGIQVFLRDEPELFSGNEHIIGRIYSGDLVMILKRGKQVPMLGDWYQVIHKDLVGWACMAEHELNPVEA